MKPYFAYGAPGSVQTARAQEATALRLASRRLTEARGRLEINRALNINHEMWSIIFRELNSPGCPMPAILKNDCIKLALWSLDYSTRAVLSDLPVAPLVAINTSVAEGLETSGQIVNASPPPVGSAARSFSPGLCA